MNKSDIMGIVDMLMADADAIRVLVAEVGEAVEPNGIDIQNCMKFMKL